MSHYTVMAVERPGGPELEEIMAPYSEHIKVDPYVSKTKAEIVHGIRDRARRAHASLANYAENGREGYGGEYDLGWLLNEPWGIRFSTADVDAMSDEEAYLAFRDYFGDPEDFDADGNLLSTYNPMSRWDYWSHGTWQSFVSLEGEETDTIRAKDVDWKATNAPRRGERAQLLERWRHLALGKVPGGLTGEEREKWLDAEYGPLRPDTGALKERYGSFDAYLRASCALVPYAVVDPDGWRAPGRVGWFGMSTETPEQYAQWRDVTLPEIFGSLGPDDVLYLLDCHI